MSNDLSDSLDEQPEPEIARIYTFLGKPLNPFSRRRRVALERIGFGFWRPDDGHECFLEKVSAHVMLLQMSDRQVDALRGEQLTGNGLEGSREIKSFFTRIADWQEANDVDLNTDAGREAAKIYNEQWQDFWSAKSVHSARESSGLPATPQAGNE